MIDVIFDEDFFSKTVLIKIVTFVFDSISKISTNFIFRKKNSFAIEFFDDEKTWWQNDIDV